MRRMFLPALLSLVGMAVPIGLAKPDTISVQPSPLQSRRRKARRVAALSPMRFRRSRGPAAKPKRRPNRNHISRRVRRRHRRKA